ncbi:MAG TPA: hypothetical protein PKE16_08740 [Hyphomicrobium sp.]|nr:hypothetical protein [Hyphomicrobium sp.]
MDEKLLKSAINKAAREISAQPLGLAIQRADDDAVAVQCFSNVDKKMLKAGGRKQFGWSVHHRYADKIPGPGYIYFTHHAVWVDPRGHLIDVTPYPEARHRPLPAPGDTPFLMDDKAVPTKGLALPPRFFAVDEGEALATYVDELNAEAQAKYDKELDEAD